MKVLCDEEWKDDIVSYLFVISHNKRFEDFRNSKLFKTLSFTLLNHSSIYPKALM